VSEDVVRRIAEAVLYEGHMLYPYRRTSLKNRQRWTFGGVYPPAYARATSDRSCAGFECTVDGRAPKIDLELRFLQYDERDEATERVVAPGTFDLGRFAASTRRLGRDVRRLSVEIENTSDWDGSDRSEAMRHTLASAHVVARVSAGGFRSAVDDPASARSDGLWPFLVGDPPDRTTLLASPIILYDYPRVAPESPGDFFDGCEIDQLLVLNILSLSDREKDEVRAGDPRGREILERTEAMTPAELMRLHGTWRAP
jgi:hypothetical protein